MTDGEGTRSYANALLRFRWTAQVRISRPLSARAASGPAQAMTKSGNRSGTIPATQTRPARHRTPSRTYPPVSHKHQQLLDPRTAQPPPANQAPLGSVHPMAKPAIGLSPGRELLETLLLVPFCANGSRAEAAAGHERQGGRACESRDPSCGVGGAEEGRGLLAGGKAEEAG